MTSELAIKAQGLFTDPYVQADPYPLLEMLRTEAPVLRTPSGAWILTRHADVRQILVSRDFGVDLWSTRDVRSACADDYRYLMMSFRDPPQHAEKRRPVVRCFSPAESERHRPTIRAIVRAMIAARQADDALDVVTDLAHDLPINVSCSMLGVPPSDAPSVRFWTDCLSRHLAIMGLATDQQLLEEQRAFGRYVEQLMAARSNDGGVLSVLHDVHRHGGLSWPETVAYVMLLLVSGRETVTNMVSTAVLTMLRHPDQAARVREDRRLLGSAVDECLRYESPVQYIARVARTSTSLGSVRFEPGDVVLASLAAANRDPQVFAEPWGFDIDRSTRGSLAFGAGAHFCLGAALARIEGEEVLDALFRSGRPIEPIGTLDDLAWHHSGPFRGLASLRLTPPS